MSQDDLILTHLKSGKPITGLEALNLYGVFRLASRISSLKKEGHNIVKEMVYSDDKHWAKYYIPRPEAQLEMAI